MSPVGTAMKKIESRHSAIIDLDYMSDNEKARRYRLPGVSEKNAKVCSKKDKKT